MIYDVVIIGAGASGLMAANLLNKEGINYLLLEKNDRVGKKLLITGGKRCNVTNNLDVDTFINRLTIRNKKFLYPALYTFGPEQVISHFNENGCPLILENNFKYFPKSNKSQSIIDTIMKDVDEKRIKYNKTVLKITKENDIFSIETKASNYQAKHVIIATGSESFPATGSSGDGLKFASNFDIAYNDFTPAETHVYSKHIVNNYKEFQGVAIPNTTVQIVGTKIKETGDLLFTHFGLSGPAIYHLSENIYEESVKGNKLLRFSLTALSESSVRELLNDSSKYVLKQLHQMTTKRVSRKLLDVLNIDNVKIAELSKKQINDLIDIICRFTVPIDKVEDKTKAYVNKGGILLKELNPQTMESKKVSNLFFVGETTDLHGPIGGFNITIAFATAHLAVYKILEK